jgi:hypothetical protein
VVWIVNAWVQVLTAPSVSVAVKLTEPLTGPALAATPVTTAVTPSGLTETVALEPENVYVAAEYVAPEGVTPSARNVMGEAVDVCPTARVRALLSMVIESPVTEVR